MATDKVKELKIDTTAAQTSVKDLRNELKELRTTLLNTEEGTKEYNDALLQAANIQHTLQEQMEEINASAMDFGEIAGNVVKATGGIVAGFQAAEATMNLFGIENEAVLKSLEKMQNLMAITQAIPAIDDGIKAFNRLSDKILSVVNRLTEKTVAEEVDTVATKANTTAMEANATATNVATKATNKWKKALVSTGLGAIVLALGYLVTNFEEISKWLDEVTGQTDFLGTVADAVVGGLNAAWAGLVQTIKAVGSAIVTYITAPFKSVWAAIQAYTSTEGGFVDKLKAAGKAMKNGFVSDWKDVGNDFKQIGVVSANAYQDGFNKNRAKRLAKNVEEAVEEGKKEGKAKGEAKAEAEEAAYKKRLKEVDTQERDEMLKLQAMGLNYEEYVAKKQELEDEFTKKRIEALQNILDTEVGLTEEEIATLKDELIKLQDSLYKKPEKTDSTSSEEVTKPEGVSKAEAINAALNTTKSALQEVADNPAWGNIIGNIQQIVNVFDDLNKNHIEKGSKEAMNAYMQVAALGFGAVGQMLNGLAAEQDTSNKKGFETAKKMQIASATMTTLSSILQALAAGNSMASQMGLAAPVGWAMGAAMATMVGTLGAVNIAKIAQQKFGGSSTTSSSLSTPNIGAINSVMAPVQYTQDVQGASIEGAIKDTRVYVTEQDISSTQRKVDVAESEARF